MMRTLVALASLLLATAASAQTLTQHTRLGLPDLPPVTADSPLDSFFYADRFAPDMPDPGGTIAAATKVSVTIPPSLTGTGFKEIIEYQLPDLYNPLGPAHPLIVAYHGFGGSAASSGNQSTVDEEADVRNWVYLSVTGLDDQLFGSPISQQNTYTAIQYMVDNFNVDPERIFMVGFSVGGGISANFAARHRDPDGIMLAGIGMVSSTHDWTMEYNIGAPVLQTWMENMYNFDGPPQPDPFNYQVSSSLYQDEASYPPTPGTTLAPKSMARNLTNMPMYMTYDILDTIVHVPHVNDDFEDLMNSIGGAVTKTVVSGTVYPPDPSISVPHSWYVLDEVELFDFFDGKTANRYPEDFMLLQEEGGQVSWVKTTQETAGEFVSLDATATPGANAVNVSNVTNISNLTIDVGDAGITNFPVRVQASSPDGFTLRVTGFSASPSRMTDFSSGTLITGVDSDPFEGSLIVKIPPGGSLHAKITHDPTWSSVLTTTPNPVTIGTPVTVNLDGPVTSDAAYLVFSLNEALVPIGNVTMTALPLPPVIIRLVPLDVNGDVTAVDTMPNDPALVGLRFPSQAVTVTPLGDFETVSNLWGLYID